jgi:hypothetical protein
LTFAIAKAAVVILLPGNKTRHKRGRVAQSAGREAGNLEHLQADAHARPSDVTRRSGARIVV